MAAIYTTLTEAKAHLRVDFTDDDTYIAALQEMVEQLVLNEIQGTAIGEGAVQTAGTTALIGTETNFGDFSVGDFITVDGETIRTIATITDDEHLTVTVAFATSETGLTYTVKSSMPLVGGVLPLPLKQAMLLMIGHFYMVREPIIIGVNATKIPYAFQFLIAPFKNYTLA
jgi:hypothetical protein